MRLKKEFVEKISNKIVQSLTDKDMIIWEDKLAKLEMIINNLIIDLLNQKVKKTVARSITNGTQALEELRKIGYVDTPTVRYGCIAAFSKSVHPHFMTVYETHSDPNLKGTSDYFNFTKGRYEAIIHGGAPDMTKPVDWFFDTFRNFWKNYTRLDNFTSPNGFINNVDMRIIGVYQPLDCLNHIWPMDSVVSFEEIITYYENNKSNLGGVGIEIKEKEAKISSLEDIMYTDVEPEFAMAA